MVPPTRRMPVTSLGTTRRDRLASIKPSKLSSRPMTSQLQLAAALTTAPMTALRPGASPPPVSTPMRPIVDRFSIRASLSGGEDRARSSRGERVSAWKGGRKRATVYGAVGRMGARGCGRGRAEDARDGAGGLPRRVYEARPHGLRVLKAWSPLVLQLARGPAR